MVRMLGIATKARLLALVILAAVAALAMCVFSADHTPEPAQVREEPESDKPGGDQPDGACGCTTQACRTGDPIRWVTEMECKLVEDVCKCTSTRCMMARHEAFIDEVVPTKAHEPNHGFGGPDGERRWALSRKLDRCVRAIPAGPTR